MNELKEIKECLEKKIKSEFDKGVEHIDVTEMGMAIDMLKDLSEAWYHCTITEAMLEPENVYGRDYDERGRKHYTPTRRRMRYYENAPTPYSENDFKFDGGALTPEQYRDMDYASRGRMYFTPATDSMEMGKMDEKMGKSAMHRKKLVESMKSGDVATQIEHLEHYADALSEDFDELTDMLNDNERNMLKNRIQVIMQRI